ncbi:MAG: hypothetical protein BWK78_00410 [Thiotrichaceae bacterium IS1]|nr:MAG: hypothetical protein BWK78_00410 [Thiotrichaceae bacterium IS1]
MKLQINLKEPSTWRGFVYLVTGLGTLFGLVISLEAALGIVGTGLAIAGAIGFTVPDRNEVDDLFQELDEELRQ